MGLLFDTVLKAPNFIEKSFYTVLLLLDNVIYWAITVIYQVFFMFFREV